MAEPMVVEKQEKRTLSRRQLFPLAGKVAAGAAGLSVVTAGGLAIGCGEEDTGTATKAETTAANGTSMAVWPYEELDIAEVQDVAYESWYEKFCCYAVVNGVFEALAAAVGEPYKSFPNESQAWGHGGAVGWGTLCGTLTGAGIVTGLVAGEDSENIINDIINWYTVTELPIYQPAAPKAQITSVNASDSPLCHISVGKWMAKENVKFFSDERKERCARLSADVAGKTAQFLNQWNTGAFTPVGENQAKKHEAQMPAQNNCTECHGDDVPASPGM